MTSKIRLEIQSNGNLLNQTTDTDKIIQGSVAVTEYHLTVKSGIQGDFAWRQTDVVYMSMTRPDGQTGQVKMTPTGTGWIYTSNGWETDTAITESDILEISFICRRYSTLSIGTVASERTSQKIELPIVPSTAFTPRNINITVAEQLEEEINVLQIKKVDRVDVDNLVDYPEIQYGGADGIKTPNAEYYNYVNDVKLSDDTTVERSGFILVGHVVGEDEKRQIEVFHADDGVTYSRIITIVDGAVDTVGEFKSLTYNVEIDKQDKVDLSLETSVKTVVGAINEVNNKSNTNTSNIAILQSQLNNRYTKEESDNRFVNKKPDGTNDLFNDVGNKINDVYLPAGIVNPTGSYYGGTFDNDGIIAGSSIAPELTGQQIADIPVATYNGYKFEFVGTEYEFDGITYHNGDYAVCNGIEDKAWSKIDNSDQVKSVSVNESEPVLPDENGNININVDGGAKFGGTFDDTGVITASSIAPELEAQPIDDIINAGMTQYYFKFNGIKYTYSSGGGCSLTTPVKSGDFTGNTGYTTLSSIFGMGLDIYTEYHLACPDIILDGVKINDMTEFESNKTYYALGGTTLQIIEIQDIDNVNETANFSAYTASAQEFEGVSIDINNSQIVYITGDSSKPIVTTSIKGLTFGGTFAEDGIIVGSDLTDKFDGLLIDDVVLYPENINYYFRYMPDTNQLYPIAGSGGPVNRWGIVLITGDLDTQVITLASMEGLVTQSEMEAYAVPKDFGIADAGRFLKVGEDGIVTPQSLIADGIGVINENNTLSGENVQEDIDELDSKVNGKLDKNVTSTSGLTLFGTRNTADTEIKRISIPFSTPTNGCRVFGDIDGNANLRSFSTTSDAGVQSRIALFLNGNLGTSVDPTNDNHYTRKGYVNSEDVKINDRIDKTVNKLLSIKPVLKYKSLYWKNKDWDGIASFSGGNIWTDGFKIYYSDGSTQLELNKDTSTWVEKVWSGLTSFVGYNIWFSNNKIYYSQATSQYELDVTTSTWSAKTWTGLSSFAGSLLWTDGFKIYYSNGSIQYELDVTTSTWNAKTWTGLTSIVGYDVWTDGSKIYYSEGTTQYELDTLTSTWSMKTWTDLTDFYGEHIWTDGSKIYYSTGTTHYELDVATSTWVPLMWYGLDEIHTSHIWTDGNYVYYSLGTTQRVLGFNTRVR